MKYFRGLGPTVLCRATVGATALMKRVVGLLMLCLLGLHPHTAMADCGFASGRSENVSTLVLPASLTVKRDTPVGTIIYDSGWVNGGSTDIWCGGSGTASFGYAASMTPVAGMAHVYASGVAGIGIKAAYSNSIPSQPPNIDNVNPAAGSIFMEWPRQTSSYGAVEYTPAGIYRVQFIATGPIPVGTNTMLLPAPTATSLYGSLETNKATFTATTFTVNSVGCTVNAPSDIQVTLNAVPKSQFTGVGSRSTYAKSFSIDLMCPDSSTAVSYRIDDTGNSGLPASTGVLANVATASPASGIGVQVLKSDGATVVPLATQISYITTSTNNQAVSIPLVARYYQTSAAVFAGSVKSYATFTMFYQ